jgi:phospholipid/cholesterol/gamma-HCH transport system permease protein
MARGQAAALPGRAYHPRVTPPTSTLRNLQDALGDLGRSGVRSSIGWSVSWWHVVRVGAMILVLALSPSTYNRANRGALARHVYLGTAPSLPWFALMSAVVSVVLIRIVVVTALSYGLSQYALEMVVRVLVLELIPLGAALFVALRSTVPSGAELIRMHRRGAFEALLRDGVDPLRHELLPRVVAGIFAVLMLASVSCLIAMVLAYLAVYGFTLGAFAGFTRTLGAIFNPGVALIFALKTLFFSLAVALIPVAAFLRGQRPAGAARASPELESLVRLFAAILVIEVASLVGNYR